MPSNIGHFDFEPVDALEFQPGTDPNQVLAFLAEHSDEEFSAHDIHEAIDFQHDRVHRALVHLDDRGLAHRRGRSWTIADPDATLDWTGSASTGGARSDDLGKG